MPNEPFKSSYVSKLFTFVKKGNINEVKSILSQGFYKSEHFLFSYFGSAAFKLAYKNNEDKSAIQNRYLVYQFDYMGQTMLHLAVKKNNVSMTRILLE